MKQRLKIFSPFLVVLVAVMFIGCATSRINWNSRIGNYTYDQAILEMGPPDRTAKLSDGRTVAEWLTFRGTSGQRFYPSGFYSPYYYGGPWYYNEPSFPDQFILLTFSPEGLLENWKKIAK